MRSFKPLLALALLVPTAAFAGNRHRDHARFHDHHEQPVAYDPGSFGAISYSPSTGRVGWSYGYGDGESAKAAATGACGVGDCAWQVMEQNEYAVLALGTGGPAVAWNADYDTAAANALQACSALGDGCYVSRWVFR